ncbi:uncharacterized protein [Anas platyrhynchos]|uniref:uncharacterized protein isoform X1 n=1 Tax=Anas platyrhynchos TaxID=8839 RepID=UPI003AF2B82B
MPTQKVPAAPQASVPLSPAQSEAETRSRRCSPKAVPQKMLGQAPWARLSPSVPAVLLLALCGSMTSQDICISSGTCESFPPRPRALGSPTTVSSALWSSALWQPFTAVSPAGDLLAPALQMNSTSAQPGTTVLLQCILPVVSSVIRIIICKDGKQLYSEKAHQGQLSYSVVLNITSRSAGRYTCGYQQRNEMKQRRSSALSAGRILNVPGNVASSPASPSPPAPHARILHTLPIGMVLAVAAVGLILLAAGSWFAIRKGACRGRCPRQQHVDRPQMETTDSGEVTYSTIVHVRWDRPCPMQQMSDTTTYAMVTTTQTR